MGEPAKVVAPKDSQRYQEVASKLRRIARQSRLSDAQQKIFDFASRLADAANRPAGRGPTEGRR
jgi:hypothetical protein